MNDKFELTDITHPDLPHLRRIRALRGIPCIGVKAGDLGGWIEEESNLDQSGDAWVSGNAKVFGNARVFGYARVYGNARVFGYARVYGNAKVFDNARVFGYARVYGNARVCDDSEVSGDAWVFGDAGVFDNAKVFGGARVFGDAWVSGGAWVSGNAEVSGGARVVGDARVSGADEVLHALVMGSALFRSTLYRTKDGHALHVGCWSGTVHAFRTMIESDQWVDATPEQIKKRRPELLAFTAMCEARIATWGTRGRQ